MQKYCVIARFDDKADGKFREWKDKVYSIQKEHYDDKQWPPHLTIALYEDIDINKLCEWTEEFAASQKQIPIVFCSFGVFPHGSYVNTDIIFANPATSLALVELYYGFHKKLDEFCGKSGYAYSAVCGYPAFHSTITICHKNEFNSVFDYLRDESEGASGKIVALEVYEIPMKLVKRYDLQCDNQVEK